MCERRYVKPRYMVLSAGFFSYSFSYLSYIFLSYTTMFLGLSLFLFLPLFVLPHTLLHYSFLTCTFGVDKAISIYCSIMLSFLRV